MGLGHGWKIVDLRDVGGNPEQSGDLEQSGQVTARSPPKAPPRFSPCLALAVACPALLYGSA